MDRAGHVPTSDGSSPRGRDKQTLGDENMLKLMGRENGEDYSTNF